MDRAHHMAVRELDLRSCHPHSIVDKINAVPGLRTSTAFFTFLRANVLLNPSALSSNYNTPVFGPSSHAPTLQPPSSPSPLATNAPLAAAPATPLVPLDDIPPLSLETLSTPGDRADGIDLVADSVAQMRPRAARALAGHPLCLAALAATLLIVHRFSYAPARDPLATAALGCGITGMYLIAARFATRGYLALAEETRESWLQDRDAEEDVVLGARYDDGLVGALVLRLRPSSVGRKKGRTVCLRGGRGVIRAWTTRRSHRGQGIGRDMLAAAVRITKERCGKDAELGFAQEHANSLMLLPRMFNGTFRRDEVRATVALDDALGQWEASKRKR